MMKAVSFINLVCAKGDELWRFIEILTSVQTRFNALSLGTSAFLIDGERLFSMSYNSLCTLLTE